MLSKSRAIVLRTYKYSETSIICKVFTEQNGLLSFMVPGVRSAKNRRGNILQSGQLLEIDYYFRANKNFQRFKEYKTAYIPIKIYADIRKSAVHAFIMELAIQLIDEGEEQEELFESLFDTIVAIDKQEINAFFPLLKLLEFAQILGFMPARNYSSTNHLFCLEEGQFTKAHATHKLCLSKNESANLFKLLNNELQILPNERKVLLDNLLLYFKMHLPNFKALQSVDIMGEVLRA